jgi:predicted TIM-barrel fold metal-dependent hydrolase
MIELAEDFRVIDADTHYTEPYDLWTSRAPAQFKDRVPHVETVDDQPTWIIDGASYGFARGGGVIGKDNSKLTIFDTFMKGHDWVHPGAYDPKARLEMMDECGIHAQVLYPNIVGNGGTAMNGLIGDPELRKLTLQIYNNAMADLWEESGHRLIGMAVLPAWDLDACVKEAERVADLGLRGVNMTTDPQNLGSPDFADPAWDRLWEVCVDREVPVHFHIAGSNTAADFLGQQAWPSQTNPKKLAVAGVMLILNSARVLINATYAGIFDRFPKLQMVLVESGIGYIPFMLEAMDYHIEEMVEHVELSKKPSEYFKSNWYATFWFEGIDLQHNIDKVGDDRILFETDFPHPTCVYPQPLKWMADKMNTLRPESRNRIMGENAVKLYRL